MQEPQANVLNESALESYFEQSDFFRELLEDTAHKEGYESFIQHGTIQPARDYGIA